MVADPLRSCLEVHQTKTRETPERGKRVAVRWGSVDGAWRCLPEACCDDPKYAAWLMGQMEVMVMGEIHGVWRWRCSLQSLLV